MALPSLTTTINPYPTGRDKTQKWQIYKGKIVIGSGGLYATNGLPWKLTGAAVLTNSLPDWVEAYSLTTGYTYKWDPVNQTWRIYESGAATGTISAPTLTMDSYTPAGTNAAPTLTMDSYTPAGSVAAPTISVAAGTPATNPVGAGATSGNTDLVATDEVTINSGISAPAFTGTAQTLTGTNSAPAFTGTAHTLTGSISAPTFTGSGMEGLVELGNGASVAADTIYFRAECASN